LPPLRLRQLNESYCVTIKNFWNNILTQRVIS
jgi:hypothetical protein